MRLLVVSPHVPYEGIPHAGGSFLLRHLERMARSSSITLVAPLTRNNVRAEALAPAWLRVVLVASADPGPGRLRREVDRWQQRLRGWSAASQLLRDLAAAGLADMAAAVDLVELHWPEYAHVAPPLRRAGVTTPIVVVDHDVASEAQARRYATQPTRRKRLTGRVLHPVHRWAERRALSASDLVLVFKQADVSLLRRLGLRTEVLVIDPWLDQPTGAVSERDPALVLFTAAFWRLENQDAAAWLLERVWPRVLAAVPSARLQLVGAGPSTALRALAASASAVEVTGQVDDLEPYYQRAGVFAAPVHVGGGLKFKVPQAMLFGLPVVATSVAAEGIVDRAPSGTFWGTADDDGGFAELLVEALRRPDDAARTGRRAQAWCRATYDFERSGAEILAAYDGLLSRASLPACRSRQNRSLPL